jgi:hypothetical protein
VIWFESNEWRVKINQHDVKVPIFWWIRRSRIVLPVLLTTNDTGNNAVRCCALVPPTGTAALLRFRVKNTPFVEFFWPTTWSGGAYAAILFHVFPTWIEMGSPSTNFDRQKGTGLIQGIRRRCWIYGFDPDSSELPLYYRLSLRQ